VPAQDRLGLDQLDGSKQFGPKPSHRHHDGTVDAPQTQARRCAPQSDLQLVPLPHGFKSWARLEQVDDEDPEGL
jgi:hypothetical protein